MGVPATSTLIKFLLVVVTDANIAGSNWSAMIRCLLGASYSFLSDEVQYPEVLNRTHPLHTFAKGYNGSLGLLLKKRL